MPGVSKPEIRAKVKTLALLGMTRDQIAAEAGITYWSVNYYLHILEKIGEIPRSRERRGLPTVADEKTARDRARMKYGAKFGTMGSFAASLTDDQLRWLASQVPQGGTFADVLRGIVTDAYHDDLDRSGVVKKHVDRAGCRL